jgi:hypothetical protein
MELLLQRKWKTQKSTVGELFVSGANGPQFFCYTLEDVERTSKIAGKTAIRAGKYPIQLTYSPRFKQIMPLLIGVPNFEGVRIHWGNKAEDTDGCILVGDTRDVDWVGQSKVAYERLIGLLNGVKDNIVIHIN